MNTMDGVVICSFYTGDDYYRTSADALRSDLDRLGLRSVIEEIEKPDGTDWADICRKKIPFVARVCESHPNDRVFWIDVDCRLLDIPDYVRNSTADLLGFQRGFVGHFVRQHAGGRHIGPSQPESLLAARHR